jgi:hypothetical protein
MNKEQLRLELEKSGVRPYSYSLDGASDEAYCLDGNANSWSVYYYERGVESGKKTFANESDACEYLLSLLKKDPTAQS